ncbi:hypothetical protein AKG39_09080 [Acetobacterium bakii]|uniref:Diguanylate cyclase n=1 Tax=Acetobacterium bakii TaxID=52689 RepID=A0A0L6U0G0_9FIRM|nr:hypothetical protein AKG39_09080 [Acetobacterium bakii]
MVNYLLIDRTARNQAELELKESEEKYRLLVTQMEQGLAVHEIILDEQGNPMDYRFLDVNESFEEITGLKRENILGKTVLEALPGTENYWIERYGQVALTGEALHYENYSKELKKYFEVIVYAPRNKQFAVIISDITKRKELETALSNEKNILETTLKSVGDGVISTDIMGKIVFLNMVGEDLTGWTQEEAKGKEIDEVFNIINEFTGKKSDNIVKKVLETGNVLELDKHTLLISKDGTQRPIEDSVAPILKENGVIAGAVLVFRDFSEKKKKQEEILYLNYHDYLTGLYNRRYYEEALKKLDTKENLPLTLVMGDVNGLKLINDSFGHTMGDELLQKAAKTIEEGSRKDDIVARLGGDEFIIVLPRTDIFEAEEIVKQIRQLTSKEKIGAFDVSISFGYETKEFEEEDIQEIFKKAEDDMYRHKLYESSSTRSKSIELIMNNLYERSHQEMRHSKSVAKMCEAMGTKLHFNKAAVDEIKMAGLMHDIGKMGIDEKLLNRSAPSAEDEYKVIRKHPEIGYRILSASNEFSEMAKYVLEHHERWDGKGYPKGLKDQEISLQARIIAVADAFDSMTNKKCSQKSFSRAEAIDEIKKNMGTQFDPDIAKLFLEKCLPEMDTSLESIMK